MNEKTDFYIVIDTMASNTWPAEIIHFHRQLAPTGLPRGH